MRILLTNDDGIDQPGLTALEKKLADHEIWVVAPAHHCSGIGQGLGLYSVLSVEQTGNRKWSVEGTPTDCVKLALSEIMPGNPPELVISGINPGLNLANNIYYSGTVAAATEASFWGFPAFAASQEFSREPRFDVSADIVADIMESGIHGSLPGGTVLNINIPFCRRADIPGCIWTRTGRFSEDVPFRVLENKNTYAYDFCRSQSVSEPSGTDVHALRQRMVSLSLLQTDRTCSCTLPDLPDLIPGG